MDSLLGKWPRRLREGLRAGGEEIHKFRPVRGGDLAHGRGVGGDVGTPGGGARIRALVGRRRREQHHASARMQPGDLAQERLVVAPEVGEPGGPGESLVGAETEHDDVGRPGAEQALQVFHVAFRPQAMADLVAGPCEAAHAEPLARMGELKLRLEVARLQQALHHPAAVEQERVAGPRLR
jgi:hypothetical protein